MSGKILSSVREDHGMHQAANIAHMQHQPVLRVDHVGSLLRPQSLVEVLQHDNPVRSTAADMRALEDAAILEVIAMQEALGLPVITDGEFRRKLYSDNFTVKALTGVSPGSAAGSWVFKGGVESRVAPMLVVTDCIRWSGRSTNAADFSFLNRHAKVRAKITLPGPAFIHYRAGRANISRDAYPNLDQFWSDIVEAYRAELASLAEAQCTYVQFDETSLAKFGDPEIRRKLAERGDDWQELLHTYVDVLNAVVDAAPAGMDVAMHLCRGNNQGQWQAEGGYEDVAETLFHKLRIRRYLMEFDTPRAGSLNVLRALPDDKVVVLGLISTKVGELELRDAIHARIREAAQYTGLERLAVSPQCGFASEHHGNPVTVEQQNAKLRLCVELASEVWT